MINSEKYSLIRRIAINDWRPTPPASVTDEVVSIYNACVNKLAEARPTFDDIASMFEKNMGQIMPDVNAEEFMDFVDELSQY